MHRRPTSLTGVCLSVLNENTRKAAIKKKLREKMERAYSRDGEDTHEVFKVLV